MAGQTLRRKAAAPAPEAPDASEVAAVEVVEPVRAEDVALAVGEPLVTRMADPDGGMCACKLLNMFQSTSSSKAFIFLARFGDDTTSGSLQRKL